VSSTPALIFAGAGVGFAHAVLPDHWLPLATVGRSQGYSRRRIARIAAAAGTTHVAVSLVLGALVIAIGLQLRGAIAGSQQVVVGALLLATGLWMLALHLRGHGHSHRHPHDHHHPHAHRHAHDHHHHDLHSRRKGGRRSLGALMVAFGAAASPDLTILPVFFAASALGVGAAVGSLVAFTTATIVTIVALTVIAHLAGGPIVARLAGHQGNSISALVLLGIGTLVLAGVL
jgi:nickel/cobalt exporter